MSKEEKKIPKPERSDAQNKGSMEESRAFSEIHKKQNKIDADTTSPSKLPTYENPPKPPKDKEDSSKK